METWKAVIDELELHDSEIKMCELRPSVASNNWSTKYKFQATLYPAHKCNHFNEIYNDLETDVMANGGFMSGYEIWFPDEETALLYQLKIGR